MGREMKGGGPSMGWEGDKTMKEGAFWNGNRKWQYAKVTPHSILSGKV